MRIRIYLLRLQTKNSDIQILSQSKTKYFTKLIDSSLIDLFLIMFSKAFLIYVKPFNDLQNQTLFTEWVALCSVLCQSRSKVQNADFTFTLLVIDLFDLVLVLQSGHLTVAFLFDSFYDHSDSFDFSLSCDKHN